MRKKLIIISSIMVILLITSIFISMTLKDNNITFETSQTNTINSDSLNVIENIESKIVNDITNETIVEVSSVDTSISEPTTSQSTNEKNTTQNNQAIKTSTKEETKPDTKVQTNNTPKKETPNEPISNEPQNKPTEEKPTTPTKNAKPELAYSTYRKTNNDIIPEVIKILNDEISKDSELVAFGSKAVKGNKADALAKTSGFTYLWVDIETGKVSKKFTERVRNVVGGFGNYNVYAEDEFTYNAQGLNPKWSQTLVWIYLTF